MEQDGGEGYENFFQSLPVAVSQRQCHNFARSQLTPAVLGSDLDAIKILPSQFQGSLSYTCILMDTQGQKLVVQFRAEEQDLAGIREAHRIFGDRVPPVTFRGEFQCLYVYSSPFADGTPFIHVLTSHGSPPLLAKLTTTVELADFCSGGARQARPTGASQLRDALLDIQARLSAYSFRRASLKGMIEDVISRLMSESETVSKLPVILAHQDLSPFNYLIDGESGQISAVLDWDDSTYEPVGSNFHFAQYLFGHMTREGWVDAEECHELEDAFYSRVIKHLEEQGFPDVEREHLEYQKAVGVLQYWVTRLFEWKDARPEHYLEGYLVRLSFLEHRSGL